MSARAKLLIVEMVVPEGNEAHFGFAQKVETRAPKARDMKARGKREAKWSASPLVRENDLIQR
jgi:hypothetical protein